MQPVERAHWRRRDAQLRSLLDLDGAARDAWLADYARVDAAEADHLRRLLRQAETAGPLDRIRAQSAYRDALHQVSGIDVGSTLGEWTIERRLGIGGMAEVFLARRERGAITQRAALKVVATSVATADLHARFLGEQRMLARLSDARIARYYDSGVTGDGRPWMAMEFVDGTPIDRHCREKHLWDPLESTCRHASLSIL